MIKLFDLYQKLSRITCDEYFSSYEGVIWRVDFGTLHYMRGLRVDEFGWLIWLYEMWDVFLYHFEHIINSLTLICPRLKPRGNIHWCFIH